MITDLRTAVEWLITLKTTWTLDDLAALADAKRDRAQYYATRLVNDGVLVRVSPTEYHAGPGAAAWRETRPQSGGKGGNASCYRRQREVRENLRGKEFQAMRSGTAIHATTETGHAARVASTERNAVKRNTLTCNRQPQGTVATKEDAAVTIAPMVSPQEAARTLGVHENTVLRAISVGDLTALRIGPRLWRIRESDLTAYIERSLQKTKERVR